MIVLKKSQTYSLMNDALGLDNEPLTLKVLVATIDALGHFEIG